jgi:hypothetical protein
LDAAVLRFRDFAMEGVDIFRLRWFAAFNGRLWLGQPMTTPNNRRPRHAFAAVCERTWFRRREKTGVRRVPLTIRAGGTFFSGAASMPPS